MNRYDMVKSLTDARALKTQELIDAFKKIDRVDFVPPQYTDVAYEDAPLDIGYGQTISQPYTVAFMLELLKPDKGQKILEIGAGSGWQAALLAAVVGSIGRVYAVERVPELADFATENLKKYNFIASGIVEVVRGDGSNGLIAQAPFDRIIAAASADRLPNIWVSQLALGGRLVAPVRDSVQLITKSADGQISTKEYPGFLFVPLVSGR